MYPSSFNAGETGIVRAELDVEAGHYDADLTVECDEDSGVVV